MKINWRAAVAWGLFVSVFTSLLDTDPFLEHVSSWQFYIKTIFLMAGAAVISYFNLKKLSDNNAVNK